MKWPEWNSFRKESISQIPEEPGVYQLRSLGDDGNPQSISRLQGKDPEGIVYIGESSNLKKRIKGF
jgi:excinuclease UvrABC nuclease subunit